MRTKLLLRKDAYAVCAPQGLVLQSEPISSHNTTPYKSCSAPRNTLINLHFSWNVLATMESRPRTRRRRISYILRSGCQDQRTCVVKSIELSGTSGRTRTSPTPRDQLSLPENVGQCTTTSGGARSRGMVDSAYFTSSSPEGMVCSSSRSCSPAPPPAPLHPHAVCPTKTRTSTWMASLRQLLTTQTSSSSSSLSQQNSTTEDLEESESAALHFPEYLAGCTATVPEGEAELDRFLFEVWTKDTVTQPRSTAAPVSHYVRKVSELRFFFEQKMMEVAQREAAYLSELMRCLGVTIYGVNGSQSIHINPCEQLSLADSLQLKQILLEAKVNYKFDQIRYTLKKEAAETVAQLRAQYIAEIGRKKKRLPQRATKLLNEWFEQHLDHPYPTEVEKRQLSTRCDITVEQVSRWFTNKRTRSKATRGIPQNGRP